jgi:DNA-binding beta-propeller fold protein YncE
MRAFSRQHYKVGPARGSVRVALAVVALCLAVVPSGASAALGQGHRFGSAFGSLGTGPGQLGDATGVAVSDATGDVYVVDAAGERVEVYAPDGQGGYGFASEFKVRTPGAIVVDNSTSPGDATRGDVYVAGTAEKESTPEERDLIYEYSPTAGEVIHKWGPVFKTKVEKEQEELELEDISGLSVDAAGNLWVYWEEEGVIDELAKEASKGGAPRLVWRPASHREPDIEFRFECEAHEGFAVAPDDSAFYTAYERENIAERCPGEEEETPDSTVVAKLDATAPEPGTLIAEVDHQDTSGVAVDDAAGVVYLDNRDSIAAFTPEGVLIQRFGSEQLAGASGVAVDSHTGDVFVAEPSRGEVDVFAPEEAPAAPEVDGLSASGLSPSSAQLVAKIDAKGAGSEYVFSYGTGECATNPGACTQLPAGKLAAGFGDREVTAEVTGLQPATAYFFRVVVTNAHGSAEASPAVESFTTLPSPSVLPDGRAWEMVTPVEKHSGALVSITRFTGGSIQSSLDGDSLAWLASGPVLSEVEGSRSFEPAQQLSTRGAGSWGTASLETAHEQGRGLLLPSPTEYHYFSPDLSTSLVEPTEPTRQVGGVFEHPALSAEATEKTMYVRQGPPSAPTYTPLVTASNDSAETEFGGALEFLDASSDLSHVVFESKVGLTASAPSAAGLYEWSAGAPLKLVSVLPGGLPAPDEETGEGFTEEPTLGDGGGTNDRDAISSDGTRVFWSEERRFVPESLYLSDTATGETIKVNAAQGNGATETGAGGATLPEPAREQQEVHFQGATGDGTKVFFTDTARLSEESGQEPTGEESPTDLYEFELTSSPGAPLRGRLVDLTPDPTAGSADVLNLITGTSEDGSSVYFVANGALAPGATPGRCARAAESSEPPPAGSTCNLYVNQPDPEHVGERETRLIAKLDSGDAADWGAGVTGSGTAGNLSPSQDLAAVTSRVSPNGQYLAFMSERGLTGYDTRDAASGQLDEEVYLYDATSGRVICASCNPNGEQDGSFKRPHGVFDTRLGAEGFGLLVDRPEIWQERWVAGSVPGWNFNITNSNPAALYQPRYLSDGGRLFFDSSDDLVPADQNGVEDVYEYEPTEVGTCRFSGGCLGLISSGSSEEESAFMDASQDGGDVFFQTAAQLVAADDDHAYDIYDARVCSESVPCFTSTGSSSSECESSASCRESTTPPAQVAVPPTSTFAGPPSVSSSRSVLSSKTTKKPLTRKQKLAKALKQCHKLKHKSKRVACERAARKRYAPPKKHSSGAKK